MDSGIVRTEATIVLDDIHRWFMLKEKGIKEIAKAKGRLEKRLSDPSPECIRPDVLDKKSINRKGCK